MNNEQKMDWLGRIGEKIVVNYYDDPSLSFSVTQDGNKLNVYQQARKLQNVDTAMIYRYLNAYKKVHFDLANFELTEKQIVDLITTGKTSKIKGLEMTGTEKSIDARFVLTKDFGIEIER